MILLAGFIDVLFRALVSIGLALGAGGIVFAFVVLRPLSNGEDSGNSLHRCLTLAAGGAFLAGLARFLTVAIAPWALADEAGRWPLAPFLATTFARMGLLHALCCCGLGGAALRLRGRPDSRGAWYLPGLLVLAVMGSGAWLVHGASRLDHAAALMTTTVIHQFAAMAWIGGTMHLSAQRRQLFKTGEGRRFWPRLPEHFSPLALTCVAILVSAGAYLSWNYVHGVAGMVGTAYGAMLLTKITLMGSALCLGGANFLTLRAAHAQGDPREVQRRVPAFVETEAGIGTAILIAAAALTGQPPAVDVVADRATLPEVLRVFAPKMPQWTPAPWQELLAGAQSSLDPFALPTALGKIQSNFNHNISGLFVIMLGLGALLDRATGARWARHWPLLFLPFALFLILFAEPNGWPLGNEGFWATLAAPDVLQHRLATLLVAGLGLFQWRVRTGTLATTRWRYAFPLLCGAGGALLLADSHSVLAVKWAFLIEVSDNAIGILAVLMGGGGWLELRLPEREGRLAGLLWPVCFILVGVVLLFYRET